MHDENKMHGAEAVCPCYASGRCSPDSDTDK